MNKQKAGATVTAIYINNASTIFTTFVMLKLCTAISIAHLKFWHY